MFNELPIEIYAEIFKSLPNQKKISKRLNQYNQQFFYNQYHDLEIHKNEILKYITTSPDHFILFYEKMVKHKPDKYFIYLFNHITDGQYQITLLKIKMHPSDGYHLSIINKIKLKTAINYIEKLYTHMNPLYVSNDLFTIANILKNRNLDIINPNYTKQYILDTIQEHTYIINSPITNMFFYFEFVKSIFYIDLNINIGQRQIIQVMLKNHKKVLDIYFKDSSSFYDKQDIHRIHITNQQYEVYKQYLLNRVKNN